MINEDRKKVIHTLYAQGKKKKEISRLLNLSPKTVRKILKADLETESGQRSNRNGMDIEHLRELYTRCNGYVQRMHEILREEDGADIGYSTLTRIIRENDIGRKINKRCFQVADIPGDEMQHDTTTYKVKLGDKTRRVVCSGLYLRYSKMRYIKFYFHFNRFKMKCFFYEALKYWGYTAKRCVIDNTNLAVLHGTGDQAVFNPEMTAFCKSYGFEWLTHEKGHANRKAGCERNFWSVETNFLPGRSFEKLEDLNLQGFDWATERYAKRPQSGSRLIPGDLFEYEKPDLIKLPDYLEPPYQPHQRTIDEHGYVAFDVNYYWVPGKATGEVPVIEYPDRIKIFPKGQPPVEYTLPAADAKNQKFAPEGVNTNPYEPRNIKKTSNEEEKQLRSKGEICCVYLDFIKSKECQIKQKPKFIRQIYMFSKKTGPGLLNSVLERALKYRVANIDTLTRISYQLMKKEFYDVPEIAAANDYEDRETYQQGRFSFETELKYYQDLLNEDINDTEEHHE